MFYRRNTDDDLRTLEREFATQPQDRALLKRINHARRRAGLPAHPQTRIEVALDRRQEMNYLSFMRMRDLMPLLDVVLVGHLESFRSDVQRTMEIRHDAMEDALGRWNDDHLRVYWSNIIQPIARGSYGWVGLPDDQLEVLHLSYEDWSHHPRHFEISDNIRIQADAHCRWLLNFFSRDSAFQRDAMIDATEDVAEVDTFLERVHTVLANWDLCNEEFYRARLGDAPTPAFVSAFGEEWWKGLDEPKGLPVTSKPKRSRRKKPTN